MRTLTVVLAADDTPRSIAYLATLGTAIPQITDALTVAGMPSRESSKLQSVGFLMIYGEAINDNDVTKGPARVTCETGHDVVSAAGFKGKRALDATAHGIQVLPGLAPTILPAPGAAKTYDLRAVSLTGKTGDVFQVFYE